MLGKEEMKGNRKFSVLAYEVAGMVLLIPGVFVFVAMLIPFVNPGKAELASPEGYPLGYYVLCALIGTPLVWGGMKLSRTAKARRSQSAPEADPQQSAGDGR
jgi:hypothetical protein